MAHVVLIACASTKLDEPAPARGLYQSTLFRKSLGYAEEVIEPDRIFVLSAKHHLLPLQQRVEPYDRTLNRMSAEQVRTWAQQVLGELREVADLAQDQFTVLAGKKYRQHLLPHLENATVPMGGMRIGEQLQFLNEAVGDE